MERGIVGGGKGGHGIVGVVVAWVMCGMGSSR